jgi:hypothetical protein
LVSIFYLFLLAVQSWYYNLFGAYVEDCENRIAKRKPLVSLVEFSASIRHNITPLHPAFSFALFIVAVTSIGFLLPIAQFLITTYLPMQYHQQNTLVSIAIVGFLLYIIIFSSLFKNWDKFTYPKIIRPISNLTFKDIEN